LVADENVDAVPESFVGEVRSALGNRIVPGRGISGPDRSRDFDNIPTPPTHPTPQPPHMPLGGHVRARVKEKTGRAVDSMRENLEAASIWRAMR